MKQSRRETLRLIVGAAAGLAGGNAYAQTAPLLDPTPQCADGDEPTPRQTAGPFYLPSSPQRESLVEPGEQAPPIALRGRVVDTSCKPIPGALLDVWHADAAGEYDLRGYRYRGHTYADVNGRFEITTIIPGRYPGRTRHYHVRVQAPNGPILTTQLYFPGEAQNEGDFLFDPRLLMKMAGGDRQIASYEFVLRPSVA
jgi:protocatechuate 3,4-dioxygenase beta subunit